MKPHYILVTVSGVALLALVGCTGKNVLSSSDGTESEQVASTKDGMRSGAHKGKGGQKGTTGSGSSDAATSGEADGGSGKTPFAGQALSGFSKKPGDESVGGSSPQMVAKLDQSAAEKQALANRETRKARDDSRRKLTDIYFAFDRWALSEQGRKNLLESADYLKQHPQAKLLIEGHCDERGSREYNLDLGEKRAKEARQFLADLGVSNPVSVTSYGKERPTCSEADESCYWQNRRAHLVIDGE